MIRNFLIILMIFVCILYIDASLGASSEVKIEKQWHEPIYQIETITHQNRRYDVFITDKSIYAVRIDCK